MVIKVKIFGNCSYADWGNKKSILQASTGVYSYRLGSNCCATEFEHMKARVEQTGSHVDLPVGPTGRQKHQVRADAVYDSHLGQLLGKYIVKSWYSQRIRSRKVICNSLALAIPVEGLCLHEVAIHLPPNMSPMVRSMEHECSNRARPMGPKPLAKALAIAEYFQWPDQTQPAGWSD